MLPPHYLQLLVAVAEAIHLVQFMDPAHYRSLSYQDSRAELLKTFLD